MKKHIIILSFLFGIFAAVLSSCSTTQTFTVQGIPGTVISKNNKQMAVIDQTGQAQLTLDRKNGYEHFFLAQTPGSNIQVPFALDYNNNNRNAVENIAMVVSFPMEIAGLGVFAVGAASENKSLMLTGLIPLSFSVGIATAYLSRAGAAQNDMNFQYDYLETQSTNNDLIR